MPVMLRSVSWVSTAGFALFLVASHWLAVVDRGLPAHMDLVLEGFDLSKERYHDRDLYA